MLLELGLISHDILIGAVEVLVQLIVECLAGNLDTDPQDYLRIYNVLFHCCLEDSHVSLTVLLRQIILLLLSRHYLIQMDLIVQVLVKLQTFEWLYHLLYTFL